MKKYFFTLIPLIIFIASAIGIYKLNNQQCSDFGCLGNIGVGFIFYIVAFVSFIFTLSSLSVFTKKSVSSENSITKKYSVAEYISIIIGTIIAVFLLFMFVLNFIN